MRKLLVVFLLLIPVPAFSQSGFGAPSGSCSSGNIYYDNMGGVKWVCISSAWAAWNNTVQSGGVWGSITGTLSSQSDLNTALSGKQASGSYSGVGNCASNNFVTGLNASGAPTCAIPSAGSVAWGAITGTLSDQSDLNTALGGKSSLNKAQTVIVLGNGTWTNMPSAQTVGFGTWVNASKVDLSLFTQGRLIVNKLATAGAASSVMRLRYATSFSQTVGNYSTMGSSEIQVALNSQNGMLDSGWINLVAGAKADNIFIIIDGVNGDGVLDPVFGFIHAQFR